jgi:hydrogenase nickel incorporation protein HypB
MSRIEINRSVFSEDRRMAEMNRTLLGEHAWTAVNMIGSPGSGKTTLLEAALPRLHRATAVIAGDIEGDFDVKRLVAAGIAAVQIDTHGACHLSAKLVYEELKKLNLPKGALIIIENVGNLVCPASFDLGENGVLAVLSAAEGHEKPYKYPAVFKLADVVAITKVDLAAAARFNIESAAVAARSQNPKSLILPLAAVTEEGMAPFISCLEGWK